MMDEDRLHQSDDDFAAVDDTVMSSTSPYQPTTEPVPHRRSFVGGWILEMHFVKSIAGAVCKEHILSLYKCSLLGV